MSHVLLADGDLWNKKLMLLGMIASLEPSVWRHAARRSMQLTGGLSGFRSVEDAAAAIGELGKSSGADVAPILSRVRRYNGRRQELMAAGRYPDVVRLSGTIRDMLTWAYGRAQRPAWPPFRGVWDRSGRGLRPGDWAGTCRLLEHHGITDVFPNMLLAGQAHYSSSVLEESETRRVYGDQLAQCLDAAHAHGLRVHAWKICWNMAGAPAPLLDRLKRDGRLQVSDTGETVNWLCPSQAANLQWEKDSVREIVREYPVDGIHLDFIRYSDSHVCFCHHCRRVFEQALGRPLANWPGDVRKGPLLKEYRRWRAERISVLVRDVSALARRVRPGVRVSAAVYGRYPLCVDSVGQDWGAWLREGIVDFVCPMNYTADTRQFADYTRSQLALPSARGRIYPGIGVTASESRLDPVQVIDQIAVLRREGAEGFVLFGLNRVLAEGILPVLGPP